MEPMDGLQGGIKSSINASVKAQYEAYPYPAYPLWLPLRGQEAYASNSLFAARIAEARGFRPALRVLPRPSVLLAGCGDTLPYLLTYWEPSHHRIAAVDLSFRNLRRARLRCLPRFRPIAWRQGNLEDPEFDWGGPHAHIDCYGVLHHLADPALALRRLAGSLLPGGTARIMVYNSGARAWIRHLQKAFDLMGLSGRAPEDAAAGRDFLRALAEASPALGERLAPLGPGGFSNASRFVDTFLHAREARIGLDGWLVALEGAGLGILGAFDRYGELDDLANPLIGPIDPAAWRDRVADRRLENNFELYLIRPGATVGDPSAVPPGRPPHPFAWKNPPSIWFSFEETCGLPWVARRRLWARYLESLPGPRAAAALEPADAWAGRLPQPALQRLARLGVLVPSDFASRELQDSLHAPLHASMEPPDFKAPVPLQADREIRRRVQSLLGSHGRPVGRLEAVMRRIEAAQNP